MPSLSIGYRIDIATFRALQNNVRNILEFLKFPFLIIPFSGFIGVCIGSLLKVNLKTKKILALVFLVAFILNFYLAAFALNLWTIYDTVTPPPFGTYTFDGHIYLKTFYLMKDGHPYYASFPAALTGRKGGFTITSAFNIRPPFLFILWMILPQDGMFVILLFIILSTVVFFLSYFTVLQDLKDPFLAILTPALMSYLFLYGIVANWFTFHEYWAWFFLAIAIWARIKKYHILMIISFILCLMVRELFFLIWFLFFVSSLINRDKKEIIGLIIAFVAPVGYYLLHFQMVSRHILITHGADASKFSFHQWFQGNAFFAELCFRFGSVLIFKPAAFGIFIMGCYIAASIKIFREKLKMYYPLAVLPLVGLFYFKMGISALSYWGMLYLPAFSYLAPFALYKNEPKESGKVISEVGRKIKESEPEGTDPGNDNPDEEKLKKR